MFRIIDLTQTLSSGSLSFPGTEPAWKAQNVDIENAKATVTRFSWFDPHAGTHIDAPLHFSLGAPDVADLELRVFRATIVDVAGPRIGAASVPTDCAGRAVLFSTGWETRSGSPEYYRGFPMMTRDAARLLVSRRAGLVGIDGPSVDDGAEFPAHPAHEILCEAHVPIVEGLINLRRRLSIEGEVLFAAFPLKLRGIEGSPVRAVALVPDQS